MHFLALRASRVIARHVHLSVLQPQIIPTGGIRSLSVQSHDATTSHICSPTEEELDSKEVKQVTKLGAIVNAALGISKGVTGFAIGSTGMIADAANSCGDLLMDAAVFFTGNGKVESLGALGVGVILMASGIGIGYSSLSSAIEIGLLLAPLPGGGSGLSEAVLPLVAPTPPSLLPPALLEARSTEATGAALAVMGVSVLAKEALFRKTLKAGQAANSKVVIANAWHHRSDVFVSLAVGAGLLGGLYDYPLLDPLVGVLVSGILVHQGLFTATDSVKDLGDRPASPEETQALRETCLAVDGIHTVERLQARLSGPFLFVDCTVGVSGTITASAAHRLSELAKEALLREHRGRVVDVVVHADPIGQTGLGELLPDWARHHGKIRALVEETLRAQCSPEIQQLSDMQVYYKDDGSVGVHLEVVMSPHMTITEANMVARHAKLILQEQFPGMTYIDIDLELDYHPTHHQRFRDSSYRYKAS